MRSAAHNTGTRFFAAALAACALALLAFASAASADIVFGPTGSGAGQTNQPSGLAVDQSNGLVYVADTVNNRVDVFNPDGSFAKAFGWGVVASGPDNNPQNEKQQVTVSATGGGFTLRYINYSLSGQNVLQRTDPNNPIPFNATAAQVQSALEGLQAFAPGDLNVTGPAGGPWSIEFTGAFADSDIPQLQALNVNLTGGSASASVTTTQPGANYETCVAGADVCRAGAHGTTSGANGAPAGEMRPVGVAVDNDPASSSYHYVYVLDAFDCHCADPLGAPDFTEDTARIQKFDPSGNFIDMLGGGVDQGPNHPGDICTAAYLAGGDTCGPGAEGTAAGQFTGSGLHLATGPGGVLYVADSNRIGSDPGGDIYANRLQTFSEAGAPTAQFALPEANRAVAGLGVDSAGDFYVTAGTTLNNAGTTLNKYDGSSGAHLSAPDPLADLGPSPGGFGAVALDPAGDLFVATGNGIAEYDSAGALQRVIFNRSNSLTPYHDAAGDFFATQGGNAAGNLIHYPYPPAGPVVFSCSASPVGNVRATMSCGLDPEGKASTVHFQYVDDATYQADKASGDGFQHAHTTPEGAATAADFKTASASAAVSCDSNAPTAPGCLAPNTTYHYRGVATNSDAPAGNIGAEGTFTTQPPIILGDTYSTDVGIDSAALHASLNPLSLPTTAHFEWVDDATYQADKSTGDGFQHATEAPDVSGGAGPLDYGSGSATATRSVPLTGLTPDTTYHYRLISHDFFGDHTGAAKAFTTFPPTPTPATDCPNQAFRAGPAASLPDCRAYEMVSPVDKNGGDIIAPGGDSSMEQYYMQASLDGDAITYSSATAFGDEPSGNWANQYLAHRDPQSGWSTHGISPPRSVNLAIDGPIVIYNRWKAFTPDLSFAWFPGDSDPQPDPAGVPGEINLYRRNNLDDSYQALPSHFPYNLNGIPDTLGGFSEDGSHTVFLQDSKLTADAVNSTSIAQTYESFPGGLNLVSLLPNGAASTQNSSTVQAGPLLHVVSTDGSRVFWTTGFTNGNTGAGKLYERINADRDPSPVSGGQCTDPSLACTIAVSTPLDSSPAEFWAQSADGSAAFYTFTSGSLAGNLYRFDLAKALAGDPHPSTLIAAGVAGVSAASDDASRAYFVSTQALASGPNPHGDSPVGGQQNIYLWDQNGGLSFVATLHLADGDSAKDALGNHVTDADEWTYNTIGGKRDEYLHAQASPDGGAFAFVTRGSITGYDNHDAADGVPDLELFRYDADANAGAGALDCVSCNPSGERPSGSGENATGGGSTITGTGSSALNDVAATIAPGRVGFTTGFDLRRFLSDDGNRLYFDSYDALLPTDTNGKMDVYEWQAPGTGDCTAQSAYYFAQNGGCLSLISTGTSANDSDFVDSSADGRDAFFRTSSSLVASDPGLIDIYDARVNGGFPSPPPAPPACEGDACQAPATAPNDQTPGSSSLQGPGNPTPSFAKPHRKKHHPHKKKHKAKKHHKRHRRAHHKRRAGR